MANPFKKHPRVKNTDGRVPTITKPAPKEGEGNTSIGITGDGSLGTNPKPPRLGKVESRGVSVNPDEGEIEKMINRNSSAFHKDVMNRCNRIKQGRRGASD